MFESGVSDLMLDLSDAIGVTTWRCGRWPARHMSDDATLCKLHCANLCESTMSYCRPASLSYQALQRINSISNLNDSIYF